MTRTPSRRYVSAATIIWVASKAMALTLVKLWSSSAGGEELFIRHTSDGVERATSDHPRRSVCAHTAGNFTTRLLTPSVTQVFDAVHRYVPRVFEPTVPSERCAFTAHDRETPRSWPTDPRAADHRPRCTGPYSWWLNDAQPLVWCTAGQCRAPREVPRIRRESSKASAAP
jgi:hypothetical protein